jgi:hypothetical protein
VSEQAVFLLRCVEPCAVCGACARHHGNPDPNDELVVAVFLVRRDAECFMRRHPDYAGDRDAWIWRLEEWFVDEVGDHDDHWWYYSRTGRLLGYYQEITYLQALRAAGVGGPSEVSA